MSSSDADACDETILNRVGALVETDEWQLPAIADDDAAYQHPHFQLLARRFGRAIVTPGTRRVFGGCLVSLKRKNKKKVDCAVCGCAVSAWYLENNKKAAHLSCALWFANTEPVAISV